MAPVLDVPPGVVTGDNMLKLFDHARANGYAIPAVNCSSSSTCNAVLEAAKKANSPVIIQVSQGGGQFAGGKGLSEDKAYSVSTAGSVALAMHVRSVAPYYGVPVVIHSDHCAKKLLPWFDQMLEADASYFAKFGEPLFSSHMLDLSEEPDEENISICKSYFEKVRARVVSCFRVFFSLVALYVPFSGVIPLQHVQPVFSDTLELLCVFFLL